MVLGNREMIRGNIVSYPGRQTEPRRTGSAMALQLAIPTRVVAALSSAEMPVQIAAILLNFADT